LLAIRGGPDRSRHLFQARQLQGHLPCRRSFGVAITDLRVAPEDSLPTRLKVVLAAEILGVYLRVRWLMRRQDIRAVVATVRSSPARGCLPGLEPGPPEAQTVALRLGGAVRQTLSVLPTDSRCLVQSLVLSRLLATRAISSTLVIGARSEPRFSAHAWVEHEGQPVLPARGFDGSRLVEM
jgi:hypothetical protein